MTDLWLADAVVILHFSFVVFVVAGGLLVLRWRWVLWLHLPALIWGALVEFMHWICPLTSGRLAASAGRHGRLPWRFHRPLSAAAAVPGGAHAADPDIPGAPGHRHQYRRLWMVSFSQQA
jgi:hypothetical protein